MKPLTHQKTDMKNQKLLNYGVLKLSHMFLDNEYSKDFISVEVGEKGLYVVLPDGSTLQGLMEVSLTDTPTDVAFATIKCLIRKPTID